MIKKVTEFSLKLKLSESEVGRRIAGKSWLRETRIVNMEKAEQ